MRLLIYMLLIILTTTTAISLQFSINEVMYDPKGSDNNNEYIEIFTDLNISGYTVEDSASSDILEIVKFTGSNYSLIVEEEFNFSEINANVYSVGATIGNNLNNNGDIIVLKDQNGKIMDVFSYTEKFGANNNGQALCRIPDMDGPFKECPPTPGNPNEFAKHHNLKINELLPDPVGDDNALLPKGEWIEILNLEDFEIDLEGFILRDNSGKELHISNTNVIDSTKIKSSDYLVIYVNGFSGLLNNEGFEEIKLLDQNENIIDEISYSNSQEGVSWAFIEKVWYPSKPTPGKDNPKSIEKTELNSYIKIENVYLGQDNKAKWGDNLRIKILVYKGNTSRESVQAWFFKGSETISKRTRLNVHDKFEEQEYTIPIQIDPNCKENLDDGDYTLIVSGLGTETTKKIKISGINSALCEQASSPKEYVYEVVELPSSIFSFESFDAVIRITNNLNKIQKFNLWTQVNNGKKIISKKDKNSAVNVEIPPASSANVRLNNVVDVDEEGMYKLSINILPENKKTPKRIESEIEIINKPGVSESETNLNEGSKGLVSKEIIYKSKTAIQKRIPIYILILVIGLIATYAYIRR
ncbi:MAG: lamin tail domain-containing protein [Nanoarchaeota archaeon]